LITYSVTITIKKEIEDHWLTWMKEIHIRDVINTGYFYDWQIQKLVIPDYGKDESTFVINYITDSIDKYYAYLENEAPRLQNEHVQKFAGKFKATRAIFHTVPK